MLSLFAPPLDIFTIVAGVVLGLCVIEILLFALGASLSKIFDHDLSADVDMHHHLHLEMDLDHDINLFHLGEVPFLVILLSFGSIFALSGLGLHFSAHQIGIQLNNLIAIPSSIFISSFFTYWTTSLWAKFFPNEESYAIGIDELLGQEGKVVIGKGDYHNRVEIAVKDKHGSTHYVMTKSAIEELSFQQGDYVTLVEKYENGEFGAIPYEVEVKNEVEVEVNR